MSIDWDSLNTFEEWAGALHKLLSSATDSIKSGEVAARVEAQKQLNDFIVQSPNAIAGEMDNIAREAINDIFKTAMDEALASIANRTADLATHVKTVQAITREAESNARSIRLESATRVVGSASRILRDLDELRGALSGADDEQALAEQIERTIGALQELIPGVMAIQRTG